jgi:hypothetical protein
MQLDARAVGQRAPLCANYKQSHMTIAALFVLPDGPYAGLPGVDVWDETRDARTYQGPFPVIAHPPCARWGRYWSGGPSAKTKRRLGDDGGCFEAALRATRRWGGVLEHPADSHAWQWFGLNKPPRLGGWVRADDYGYTCCVWQGSYGHRAPKQTWLYANLATYPELIWGKPQGTFVRLDERLFKEARRRLVRTGICQRLSRRQRQLTPLPFRDMLLDLVRRNSQ